MLLIDARGRARPSRVRRIVVAGLVGLMLGGTAASASGASGDAAANYPNRPVRLVIPFPPGGGTDILARPLAQRLSERWGQAVVIENRAGAGGNIGTENVARSPADGYSLVLGTVGTHAINQSLYEHLSYDATRDFSAIAIVANTPNILVVNPSLPVKSVPEFLDYARTHPGRLNYATPGNGTPSHLATEILKNMAHVSITHVPYKGSGPAMTDLLSGQVQVMIANAPVVLPYIKSGQLRGLASTSAQRPAMARELPTLDESGLKGYEADTWYGLFAPAGTPRAIVDKINADVAKVLHEPAIEKLYADQGAEVVANGPDEASAKVRTDVAKWRDVIQAIGVKVN